MSKKFSHRHLLGIEPLSPGDITTILDLAGTYVKQNRSSQRFINKLNGKTVVNTFFETSTRTCTSFEIAAKRLGAEVINFNANVSSISKGETLLDTMRVIDAMQVDAFVIRHQENGTPSKIVPHVQASVLNAGDGSHEHPTQALLDALTIRKHKGRLDGLKVAICGDIEHSRVARSDVFLLRKLSSSVRIFAPPMFMPRDVKQLDVEVAPAMTDALDGADVVIMLRIQNERLAAGEFSMAPAEYHKLYGLDHAKLKAAKPDVIVMHPLPMNRGVEITDELADDPKYSLVFEQIEHGVAVRMACLDLVLGE